MKELNLKKYKPVEQQKKKIKVCFYSNAPNLATGYARVVDAIASRLAKDPGFDVVVVGENYLGQPVPFNGYMLYGMSPNYDMRDLRNFFPAFMETFKQINADVIIALEDTFTLANQGWYDWSLKYGKPAPLILYLPLDGKWVPTTGLPIMRMVDKIVSMSKFTQWAAKEDGFDSDVIYHGVDLFKFKPISKEKKKELRKKYNIPEDCFLLFNYGRNNLRKNNAGLAYILSDYLKNKDPKKFKALLHIMNFDAVDMNLLDTFNRLVPREFGYNPLETGHIILNTRGQKHEQAVSEAEVIEYIQMSDLCISASTGEGFGLIMAEGAACGVPILETAYTTPDELLKEEVNGIGPRGDVVPTEHVFVSSLNTEHAYVNRKKFVEMIEEYQQSPELLQEMGRNGRKFAEQFCNWDYLTEEWKRIIRETVE